MKVSLGLLFVFLCFISLFSTAQNFDIDLLKSINKNETVFKNNFFDVTSTSVTVVNIAAPLGILAAGLIKHHKQLKKDALFIAGAYILSTLITQGSKRLIQRERPFTTYPTIIKRTEGGGYSMPSGHTAAAFNSATTLSLWFPHWYVIVPSYAWAGLVGYGRMYQGVHYPTDILAGAIVGAGSAWLAYKAEKWLDKKNTKKKIAATAPSL
jgi:membrane-associated phospholipid phosphatase